MLDTSVVIRTTRNELGPVSACLFKCIYSSIQIEIRHISEISIFRVRTKFPKDVLNYLQSRQGCHRQSGRAGVDTGIEGGRVH